MYSRRECRYVAYSPWCSRRILPWFLAAITAAFIVAYFRGAVCLVQTLLSTTAATSLASLVALLINKKTVCDAAMLTASAASLLWSVFCT